MSEHGRYTIGRKIAEGGMAEIFLGTQHGAAGFQRPVVVKRIHAVFSASPQFRNMFVDEAHIAMSLNHGNIVQVLDLGVVGGRYFLILELVDGWDLNRILDRAEKVGLALPPELALYLTAEVGRGLAYAHGRERDGKALGIVHRDVSPHNVLVSEQGEVKLSDFGIATAENRREQTLAGTVKGKIGFMSPEQAAGHPIDARSDVFSLGATLYLMATGKRPFAARSDLEALLRTQACDFPPPLLASPDLNPEVAKIVTRAMKKQPDDRYPNAEEMLLDVERVQRSELRPAGKTELKSWLAELEARDQEPPTSRARAFDAEGQPGETSLDGSVIVLSDKDLQPAGPLTRAGVDSLRPAPPVPDPSKVIAAAAVAEEEAAATFRPAPAPRDPFAAIPPTLPVDKEGAPVAPPRSPRARAKWLAVGLFAVVALGVGVWALLGYPGRPVPPPPPKLVLPEGPSGAVAVLPPTVGRPLAASQPASQQAVAASQIAAGAQPPNAPASQAAAAPASQAVAAAEGGDEVPEDDATPEEGKPAPKAPAAHKAPMVQVKLVTRPPGARVRVGRRSFGVTPRSLAFRAGHTYQIVFEKDGYAPGRSMVRVSPRGKQTVRVSLRKAKSKGWWPW